MKKKLEMWWENGSLVYTYEENRYIYLFSNIPQEEFINLLQLIQADTPESPVKATETVATARFDDWGEFLPGPVKFGEVILE